MKTTTAPHELDAMFDIAPGQTQIEIPSGGQLIPTPALEHLPDANTDIVDVGGESAVDSYDSKDYEIEDQLTQIQTKAIEAYETMIVASQCVVDKNSTARTAEVAAAFLQIALNAAKEKNTTKDRKDRIVASRRNRKTDSAPPQVTNNIVTDRETAMRLLRESRNGA